MNPLKSEERRTITRTRVNSNEPFRLRFEGGEIDAIIQDISIIGMGILTQHDFEPGTWLVVEPMEPRRCFATELRAEVRHTTKCDKDGYRVGCRFDRFLTIEDVMALG